MFQIFDTHIIDGKVTNKIRKQIMKKHGIDVFVYGFNKKTILFESSAIEYYSRYSNVDEDNIALFVDELKEHYDEEFAKAVEKDLKEIHKMLLKMVILKKLEEGG